MKISEFFLTIYFWSLSVICLLVTFVTCLILYPFIDQKTFARIYEIMTGYTMLYLMVIPGFWSLKIIDNRKDKTWTDEYGNAKRFVMVANHLSMIDSLVVSVFPLKKKFMIAHIFTRIPIFGWLARNAGFVYADRNKPDLNRDAVDRAIISMKDGCSFFIYPEGRREIIPYQLDEFKTGAYRIAYATKLPILPLTLRNTEKGMRFGAIIGFADMEIIIDEPFYVETTNYPYYIEKTKKIISSHV